MTSPVGSTNHPARASDHDAIRLDGWLRWVPLGFVIAALLALSALPIVAERRTGPLHFQIRNVAEPGRSLVTKIQVAIAIEGAELHDYLDSGEAESLQRYREAAADELAAIDSLVPIGAGLGDDVERRLVEVRRLGSEWQEAVAASLGQPSGDSAATGQFPRGVYEDLLIATALLDDAITNEAETWRVQIINAERFLRWTSVALAGVALIAVAVVASLGAQLRRYGATAERRRRDLEQAIEARAHLMRGIGHDLKNPLNAIDGHAQLLEDEIKGPLSPGQRDSIGRIRRAVQSLLALVTDLLELSRIEAGQLRIVPRSADTAAIVRECAGEHRAAAEAAGHRVCLDLEGGLPPIQTDPARVRQVLGNLLSNAVKYSPPGAAITIRMATRSKPGNASVVRWLAIDVADAGSGIPADRLEAIFEEFTRLDMHAAHPGLGVGLAIARRISHLLGGDISVVSELGRGSTFTLWLPVGESQYLP